ncbi:MAG TPA: hypothetical protein VKY85_06000 [Candidatus Angelobacter sp.]|nr:hypothetical protein [Candidatus Angelobacter sp.]
MISAVMWFSLIRLISIPLKSLHPLCRYSFDFSASLLLSTNARNLTASSAQDWRLLVDRWPLALSEKLCRLSRGGSFVGFLG